MNSTELVLIEGFWTDKSNNNRWEASIYNLDEAKKAAQTLEDCKNCTNCGYCKSCEYCESCKYLLNCSCCSHCFDCTDSRGCDGCYKCSFCSECSDCFQCGGCSECADCKSCSCCKCCCGCNEAYYLADALQTMVTIAFPTCHGVVDTPRLHIDGNRTAFLTLDRVRIALGDAKDWVEVAYPYKKDDRRIYYLNIVELAKEVYKKIKKEI